MSDHGDFTGDYGLTEKAQNTFEDCLTRVPLLIKPPAGVPVDPGISPAMTELVDFYATVIDFADVTPSHTHFGKSLRHVLAERSAPHRKYVFCEGGRMPDEIHCDEFHETDPEGMNPRVVYWPKTKAQSNPEAHIKGIMIRDERYKYINRANGADEFYDLKEDPEEKENQINNEKYFRQIYTMKDAMLKWLTSTADIVPYQLDSRLSPKMIYARAKAYADPEDDEMIKEKIRSGAPFVEVMQFAREAE